ncbi:MAG TPA: alpha/beta hydrolase-fold protein [Gemmatimonadales bacterium]|nr:alpha/beta hydrolase-fold protein [Gemmatimonadales bacterium]
MLLGVAFPLVAQEFTPRPFPVRSVESWTYKSPSMGETYGISVGLPPGYKENPTRSWPLLVVTDGDHVFPVAFDAASALAGQGDIEGVIVLSVGAVLDDGDSVWTRRRIYEFSPPNWDRQDPFGKLLTGFCAAYKAAPDKCSGGAPRFLDMIVKEIIPKAKAKYRVDMNRLGLYGISAGGFFASWVIFQPNSPFTTYIISSPATAYGDGEALKLEAKYAETHKDLKASIYLASGELEMDNPMLEGTGQIVSGMTHLGAKLKSRNYPGLKLWMEIHRGLGHSDGGGTTLNRGMRVVYGK